VLNHRKPLEGGGDEVKKEDFIEAGTNSADDHHLPQSAPSARADKKRLHTVRHGVLSKHPLEALAHRGENVRQLREDERRLWAELKPAGILGKMVFDKAWSAHLRCALIGSIERQLITRSRDSADAGHGRLSMRVDLQPTLVYEHDEPQDDLNPDLMRQVAVIQRYHAHFSREFYRAVGLLLTLRNAGQTGLTHQLEKTFGQKNTFPEDDDD
jgi:hypothetical protein